MLFQKLDLIWNISLICPWDCHFCCTDAAHVERSGNSVRIREFGLSQQRNINIDNVDRYEPALTRLREAGVRVNAFDIAL